MRLSSYFLLIFLCFISDFLLAKAPVFKEKDYANHPPRIIRTCCAFGTKLQLSYIPGAKLNHLTSVEIMGNHHYLGDKEEKNGVLYTRRGGFLDIGHLRDYIDWTAYLYNLAKKSQQDGAILIQLAFEAGEKSLIINVPANENEEDVINLAGRIAYDLSIWHEITSWFGATAVPLVSEKFSSFSVEDAYSNLLGTKIGAKAILSDLPYEQAVTKMIQETLSDLEVVPAKEETIQAFEAVRNVWWTRKKPLPNNKMMMYRNVGVYPTVSPMIAPGWESQSNTPVLLAVPESTHDGIPLSEYYTLIFELNLKVPVSKIFPGRTVRTVNQRDFPEIIAYLTADMQKKNFHLYK